jgi:putative ABC transport system substrate-binding protein
MMRRREFITLLGGVAASWPLAAWAQGEQRQRVVGLVYNGSPEVGAPFVSGLRKGLSEMGYVEGQNITIEYRWAQLQRERMPELAADLVRRRADVIVAQGPTAATAAKAATATIPIVFTAAGDPVELGLVTDLNRPGGNLTGITSMDANLTSKRVGLLHELVPEAARFAMLVDRNSPNATFLVREAQQAAVAIGGRIEVLSVGTNSEIDTAFKTVAETRVGAMLVTPDSLFITRRAQILALAARHAVPVMYPDRDDAQAGGLMSYGGIASNLPRQVGLYAGRILQGEKPGDLPIMRATKFEFVINLQTAKVIGLTVPPTLLALADDVIE